MTRLAFDLEHWEDQPFAGSRAGDPGARRHRGGHVHERPPVGLPAAPGHARPAPDAAQVLRLHGRGRGPLRDRRHRTPGLDLRSRAGPGPEPERRGLHQPADHLHPRHRRGHDPGQRGRQRGPAAHLHRQPAAGVDERGPGHHGAADLLRRARQRLRRHGRAAQRVRLPDRRGRRGRRDRDGDALDRHDRDPAGHDPEPPAVRRAVQGPGPAHQRPAHELEPAAVPSFAVGPASPGRAVPQVRQGPVPRHRRRRPARLHPGRLHGLRCVPERPGVRPGRAARDRAGWAAPSTTSATASRSR